MKGRNFTGKNDSTLSRNQIVAIIVTAIVVIGFWVANYLLLKNNDQKSSIGDMFGVVNALFSGLAFAGIIFTILLQKNELTLQRQELKETRQEFAEQNKTLRQQRFENTFFNMLSLHTQLIESMQSGLSKGRVVINEVATKDLLNYLNNITQYKSLEVKDITPEILEKVHEVISEGYHDGYYRQFEIHFNHYFRHLYHIYKFIYFADLTQEEKDFYASLVRAQLSQNELLLIAFNGIIESYGFPKFLYFMKEFDVLKNFRWDLIKEVSHRYLIRHEMEAVSYPFKKDKPVQRNVD